jgi:thiosulfate dehydrogenase [quinone] large subunit
MQDLLGDGRCVPVWLVLRVTLGWFWLTTGWQALHTASWPASGAAVGGNGVCAVGLTLAGIALILGALVGPAAFIGGCLTAGLWAGAGFPFAALHFATVVWLILTWKTAGWIGLDRWLLPLLGLCRGGALFGEGGSGQGPGRGSLQMTVRGE